MKRNKMKSTLSKKEISYTEKTGQPTRYTVQGLPYEFHKPEYIAALEIQDDRKTAEIQSLKAERDDAFRKLNEIMALLTPVKSL
jgi:hypothetical protein